MELSSLFQYGASAQYLSSNSKTIPCRVFIDTGWHNTASGYESHVAEVITVVTVLLADIPEPQMNDHIRINQESYQVISVQAQDEFIAALHVRKL